jgi:hypothetical protein
VAVPWLLFYISKRVSPACIYVEDGPYIGEIQYYIKRRRGKRKKKNKKYI